MPTPRLTLVGRLSALYASVRPRIGSPGTSSTFAKKDTAVLVRRKQPIVTKPAGAGRRHRHPRARTMACVAARSINLNHESRRTTPLPAAVRPAAVAICQHGRACPHRPARRAGAGRTRTRHRPVRPAGQPGHGLDRRPPRRGRGAAVRSTGRGAGPGRARPAELRAGHAAVDPGLRRALDLRCARGAGADRRRTGDHARRPGSVGACQPARRRAHRRAAWAVLGAVWQLLRRRAAGVERTGPGRRPVAAAPQCRRRQHAQCRRATEGRRPRAGLQHRRQPLPYRWLA
ncbi:hypothetical protein G6F32_013332 [Rhizopus arrhizus]|nr:hypothetical protein G6F32_013332 [Rhizopus arrhizus]